MHRTSTRPTALHLSYSPPRIACSYGVELRRDNAHTNALSQSTLSYLEDPPFRDGLRTPPAEAMATTYHHTQYTSLPSGHSHGSSYSGLTGQAKQYPVMNHSTSASASSSSRNPILVSQPYHPTSPQINNKNGAVEGLSSGRRKSVSSDTSAIVPNLQIPATINNSGGSLAEFAAQITCLFWFEPTETLKRAENFTTSSSPIKRLRNDAIPSTGFKKWVVTILTTTQVSQNVILLALLFIYRLKVVNPAVKGRSGSEYRLLTVALMLGNKFLDDNTYTNKTWADVSGISVGEIHVMEVEFLSNMRYSLLASEDQWQQWQKKLGQFWKYCDAASRLPVPLPSPGLLANFHTTIATPPSSVQSSPPTSTSTYTPSLYAPSVSSHNYSAHAPVLSPLPAMPALHSLARKRSYEGELEDPPAKRRPAANGSIPCTMPPLNRPDAPRLPVPNLTISTGQSTYNGTPTYSQHAPLLPPLGGRAMSSVYPTTPTWTPQHSTEQQSNGSQAVQSNGYATPSRRTSPHSTHSVQELLSLGSSPISGNHPNFNSPSFYLQQRASPYKPVRHVNTLLYPPPSASMHDYSTMNADQMHYQPLGKRNDYRTGLAYPPQHQQQWTLPQPNFHA